MLLLLFVGLGAAGCKPSITGRKPEKIIGERGLGPGQFVHPRAIAVAPDGSVFVVDKTARIQRFSADGEYETGWQMPLWEKGKPTGLSIDHRGRVLVADTHYHRVMIFDRDGNLLEEFPLDDGGDPVLSLPRDLLMDTEGNYYVGVEGDGDRISKFGPDHKFIKSFGRPGDGDEGLLRPEALVWDTDGTFWVADACHHRICHFDREGKLLGYFGTAGHGPGQLQYPYDVTLCPDGTLLVVEYGNHRLQRFDRSGKSLEMWGSIGREPGQLAAPWGVAVSRDGRVYVLDSRNDRIQMFRM